MNCAKMKNKSAEEPNTHLALLLPEIQEQILAHLDFCTAIDCRSLNTDWNENCLRRLRNEVVLLLKPESIGRFLYTAIRYPKGILCNGKTAIFMLHNFDFDDTDFQDYIAFLRPRIATINSPSCSESVKALKSIMVSSAETLELLDFDLDKLSIKDNIVESNKEFPRGCIFSNLKRLNLIGHEVSLLSDFAANIINRSPNLRQLNVPWNDRLVNNLKIKLVLHCLDISLEEEDICIPNLANILRRVASTVIHLKCHFMLESHFQILSLNMFQAVRKLDVTSEYVFFDATKIKYVNFPNLETLECNYKSLLHLDVQGIHENLIIEEHMGVQRFSLTFDTDRGGYVEELKIVIGRIPYKFPCVTVYMLETENMNMLLPTLIELENKVIRELTIFGRCELYGVYDRAPLEVEEIITGIPFENWPLLDRYPNSNDRLRTTPHIGKLSELRVLEFHRDIYNSVLLNHGLIYLNNLTRLVLPYIRSLNLTIIRENFDNLVFLGLIGCFGGKKFERNMEDFKISRPGVFIDYNNKMKCDSYRCRRCLNTIEPNCYWIWNRNPEIIYLYVSFIRYLFKDVV